MRKDVGVLAFLAWVYRDQKADIVYGRGVRLEPVERALMGGEPSRTSCDGVAAIMEAGAYGVRIDGGGPSVGQLDPDAETAHEEIMRKLSKIERALVIHYAKTDSLPDWLPGVRPKFEPVLVPSGRRKGEPVRLYDSSGHVNGTKVTVSNPSEYITAVRDQYSVWWQAVVWLHSELQGKLTSHVVQPLDLPCYPWFLEK